MSKTNRVLVYLFSIDYRILVVAFAIIKLILADGPPEHT